ncbi:MAG: hypothetical protein AAFO57_10090 [Pseudomonadota bacterium]
MSGQPKHTVLLVGDARMAFPVAKALNQDGNSVHAGVSVFSNYLEWSRHVSADFYHPSLEPGTDEALDHYKSWIEAHSEIDTLQPVSEAGLRFLSRHRDWFEGRGALIMAPQKAVEIAHDKAAMFELCRELSVPLAAFARVTSFEETEAALADIGYPAIIKPSSVDAPLFGRKALILKSQDDFHRLFPNWPEVHPELLVQRYIRGPRHSVIFSARVGELLGAVQIRAARTHEADGTGYTTYGVTVEPDPEVKRSVESLSGALDYSSTGCIQFVIDPDTGEKTFMELNARVSLGRISECAGLPHSVWGLKIAHGEPVAGFADPWSTRVGTEYVWTKGELNLIAQMAAGGKLGAGAMARWLGQTAWDALRCHHAIFDPLDPMPAIGVYGNKIISRFRNRQLTKAP